MRFLFLIFLTLGLTPALAGCASKPDPELAEIQSKDCEGLREMIRAQDAVASVRNLDAYIDRDLEEKRQASGSTFAGSSRTNDAEKAKDERAALRRAYRRNGCTR